MPDHATEQVRPLELTEAQVAAMTMPEREARVVALIEHSRDMLNDAIERHIWNDGRMVAAVCILFSGGNDSTVLAHLFRQQAHYAIHANTTIGIEDTREFVRNTCEEWGLPLIERTAPFPEKNSYEALVLDQGFPGPGHHYKVFQRLKERVLRLVRGELVANPRKERVVYLAGRRRSESQRRANIPEMERVDATVFVSPLAYWTKADLNTYRLMCAAGKMPGGPVPTNDVTAKIHMSGECLCGAFASAGERAELEFWFPEVMAWIAELEARIADRTDIPDHRKTWGWGADPEVLKKSRTKPSKVGALCSSCEDRFLPGLEVVA
jgi:3'-phosphoadenosine 5'-phosphosulfate sulfotransferase (PAPS reductase)/FAD synthetase